MGVGVSSIGKSTGGPDKVSSHPGGASHSAASVKKSISSDRYNDLEADFLIISADGVSFRLHGYQLRVAR